MPIDTLNLAPANGIDFPDSLTMIRFAVPLPRPRRNRSQKSRLVSAKSRTLIASADTFSYGFSSERNDGIASGMPTQIIDHFEIVDINEQHRIAGLMPR